MRIAFPLLAGLLAAVALIGCAPPPQPKAGPPPFKVSFRKSPIPNQGMVANVNNPLTTESIKVLVVFVQGKNEKEERSYRLDHEVKPLDSLSVGWAELKGWTLMPGDKLRLLCEGYSADLACAVPD